MTVVSYIYAQIEGHPDIYNIAQVTYDEGSFADVSTNREAIELVTQSILEMLGEAERFGRDVRAEGLEGTPEAEQLDRDA